MYYSTSNTLLIRICTTELVIHFSIHPLPIRGGPRKEEIIMR